MQNLITDVGGLSVGHAEDASVVTGVTAVLVSRPNVASCAVRGGAPGIRDGHLLEPDMTIEGIDAVVLSGGSAFGLDAAGGVMSHLCACEIGLAVRDARVPIVVQAIVFDLLNGGDKSWGPMPPYWALGHRAAELAGEGRFALGTAGGGYGATTADFKGGLGSASAMTSHGLCVGALAVVNAIGSATVGDGPHFWAAPYEVGSEFGGRGMPQTIPPDALRLRMKGASEPATTIALVATDAILTKPQAKRLALMADDGLARALRPSHAPMDGDTVFAVATQKTPLLDDHHALTELGAVAADCLARAIARGVYEAAVPPGGYSGPPAYRDVFA
ncbi:MAG: hypothetical protein RLZ98_3341 [Pseudomonadota bacterium]|jgi:D-aminopeptidase